MKPKHLTTQLGICASIALAMNVQAGDGVWTSITTPANWSDAANWQGGLPANVADGSGSTATFGTDITAATTVTLDTPRSIGNLIFSDNGAAGSAWVLTHASNILTLAGTSPTITTTTDATISSIVTGTSGLTKTGAGTLALTTKTNTYAGGTTVNAGILTGSIGTAFNGTQAGSFGTGDITVNAGATIISTGVFGLFGGQNTTRTVNVNGTAIVRNTTAGGIEYFKTLNLTGGLVTYDSARIMLRTANNGGSLNSSAASSSSTIVTDFDMTLSSLTVDTAQGTVPNGQDLVLSGNITQNTGAGSGAKSLTKTGAGTLVLGGTCNHTGTTSVNAGTLMVNGTISTAATGAVNVASNANLIVNGSFASAVGSSVNIAANATLGGTGTINRSTTLAANSVLSPGGSAIGTLTINGTLTMQGKTICQIHRTVDEFGDEVLTQDLLSKNNSLNYGGTLEVTATGAPLVAGNSFQLFAATAYSGGFTGFTMPALPAGLSWDLSNLTVDGTVKVVNFVGTPVFSPIAGGYQGTPSVTISSGSGATIYYTVNGSTPTTASPVYSGPITLPANTTNYTIKAFATKSELMDSPVATSVYNTIDTPIWTNNGDGYWSNQTGDELNWQNSVIAGGSGVTADFSTLALGQNTTVTLDGPRTIGRMIFGDASATPASNWALVPYTNNPTLTLATTSGTPSITVTNQTTSISVPLGGTQGFTKSGAGTLKLTGIQPYTDDTVVNAGTLHLDSSSVTSNIAQLSSGKIINNSAVTFYRSGTGFTHINASLSGAGDYFVDGPGGGGLYDNRLAMRGVASDNTGTIHIVNNGRLWVDSAGKNAIGDSALVDVGATASFHIYKGVSETIGGLQGSGEVWGQDSFATGTATLLVGGGDRTANFSGALKETSTKLAITKTGTGTQTLAGTNSYTGATTVDAGTLAGTGATGSDFTVKTGATLSPGTSVGTMDTKALTCESGSTLRFEVNSSSAAADKIVAHGAVSLTGTATNFVEIGSGTVAPGTKLVILDYTGQTLTGTFSGLAEGASVTIGANTYTLAYADNSRVTLTEGSGSGFSSWASANAPGQTMNMDHDNDGVPNGVEYFMGLSGSGFTANPALSPAGFISWPKGAGYIGVYGTDYVIQTSSNLGTWTAVPAGQVTIDADSVDYTLPQSGTKQFVRLKITGP